jgi:hypothetical protein
LLFHLVGDTVRDVEAEALDDDVVVGDDSDEGGEDDKGFARDDRLGFSAFRLPLLLSPAST